MYVCTIPTFLTIYLKNNSQYVTLNPITAVRRPGGDQNLTVFARFNLQASPKWPYVTNRPSLIDKQSITNRSLCFKRPVQATNRPCDLTHRLPWSLSQTTLPHSQFILENLTLQLTMVDDIMVYKYLTLQLTMVDCRNDQWTLTDLRTSPFRNYIHFLSVSQCNVSRSPAPWCSIQQYSTV